MLPQIELTGEVDVIALSPLIRGITLSLSYAATQGGIGLTATGAMNRKFVHWAATHFEWPDYTVTDLYSVNKVLNEDDVPPLWVVRDMIRHLKLLRRKKDVLLPTKRGKEFLARPQAFFDLVATDYLYSYVHDAETEKEVRDRLRWWRMFLNLLNIKARSGCSLNEVVKILYPSVAHLSDAEMTIEAWTLKSGIRYGVIRRLCWLGVLYEAKEGLKLFQDGPFHKTPLWAACLQLESDTQTDIGVH
ncbi:MULTISPECIES: hypothetical protein [Agrobacterium]|jgi:hypothetical protein|uniref:hypothetical protein n=1 Tax=Agrobacterium TaxID=357 RepID=UPI000DD05936|nr:MULTISPECIES: hypothetical protein [Agrobacterium]MBG0511105.1 hypothetical protein [Agrobacterium leguminum]MDX8327062.1 hypothetical protein [Agrobacterium tumefaciens]NTZ63597.1 hypothetical protein [Agrobacterium tumefaciens]UXR91160.1 hypothetical protein FY157_05555 [Agrobacterium tumefaciens]